MNVTWTTIARALPAVLLVLGALAGTHLLWPFVWAVLVRPLGHLWGFTVGRARKPVLLGDLAGVVGLLGGNEPVVAATHAGDGAAIAEELRWQRELFSRRTNELDNEVKRLDAEVEASAKRRKATTEAVMNSWTGRVFRHLEADLGLEHRKDVMLLWMITFVLAVDTLIAAHVFSSLGLFVGEPIYLPFFNRQVEVLPQLYGFFITLSLAGFIHVAVGPKRLEPWLRDSARGRILALALVATMALLLLLAALFGAAAKQISEVVIRIAWVMGLVLLTWLIGKIVGPEDDLRKLLIALLAPLSALLLVFSGSAALVQIVFEKVIEGGFEVAARTARARAARRLRNDSLAYEAHVRGVVRGATI